MSSQEWEGADVRHTHLGVEVTKPGSQYTMILKPQEFEAKIAADALESAAQEWSKHQDAHMGRGMVQQIGIWLRERAGSLRNSL